MSVLKYIIFLSVVFFLFSCTSNNKEKKDTSELWSKSMASQDIIKRSGTKLTSKKQRESGVTERDALNRLRSGGGLLGQKGISLSTGGEDKVASVGMPINPYLWRASLESINFMPLSSADPFGGIIITEWYNDKKDVDQRCKVNIFIKGVSFLSENLKATIYCQQKESGNWIDKKIDTDKSLALENAILEKAKKIRLSNQ